MWTCARVDFRVDGGDLVVAVRVTDDRLVARPGGAWDERDAVVVRIDEAPDGEFDNEPYLRILFPTESGEVDVVVTDRDWETFRPEWELDWDYTAAGRIRLRARTR